MRILVTADLHGLDSAFDRFASILSEGAHNLGILAGDLMTFPSDLEIEAARRSRIDGKNGRHPSAESVAPESIALALRLKEKLLKLRLVKGGKPILFLMGNDDGIIGNGIQWTSDRYIVDINQKRMQHGIYGFVGYQYTTTFVGGSFEKSEAEQEIDLGLLEPMLDERTVLISHGPARGILDNGSDGKHYGGKALARLLERKRVRLHVFGHIHASWGTAKNSVNCAYPFSRQFASVDLERDRVDFLS